MTKVAIPTSPAELAEVLNDSARMKELWDDKESWGEFIQGYADSVVKADQGDMAAQIREQVQVAMAESLKANGATGAAPPVPLARDMHPQAGHRVVETSARKALYNRRAAGNAVEGICDDAADFFQAIYEGPYRLKNGAGLAAKRDKLREIQNSFGSEVPADGGFLIPEVLRSNILEVALETAIVRPRATVIPMDSLRVPIPMVDSTSNVSSIFGGITFYWTEEAAALTESQASFGRVVLDAKKLTGYCEVPNELLADAPAFSAYFDSLFPRATAWFEDIAFMTGTGVGEPLGFINCPASVQTAAEAGQPTQTIVWENITKMFARMLPTALGSAVWVASIDTFPQLATMALSVGTGGGPVWIGGPNQPGSSAPPVSILGRPVYFTEKTPALGTTGDISFVDLSYYLIGDRMQMQSMSSPHYKFANDKMAFRVTERLDGRPWLQSAITPHNNSANTLTPFVQLASR
jgi:HK97 family phage major capsid protein